MRTTISSRQIITALETLTVLLLNSNKPNRIAVVRIDALIPIYATVVRKLWMTLAVLAMNATQSAVLTIDAHCQCSVIKAATQIKNANKPIMEKANQGAAVMATVHLLTYAGRALKILVTIATLTLSASLVFAISFITTVKRRRISVKNISKFLVKTIKVFKNRSLQRT